MSAEVQFAVYTIAAPLATAMLAALLLGRLLPAGFAERCSLGLALAAGFAVGYWLLPDWAPLVPDQHWHWLPYVGAAAVLEAIGLSPRWTAVERWLLNAIVALVAAGQLVPDWPDLLVPREFAFPLLALYLLLITGLLTELPDHLIGRTFVALLAASAATTATLVALEVSMKYGQMTAAAAAAVGGCSAATLFPILTRRASEGVLPALATPIRGLIPVYAVLAGGSAFVGTIEPSPPLPIILVAPAAPLMLWLFAAGPLAQLKGWTAAVAQAAVVLVALATVITWVAVGSGSGADEW